jgi:hypothetical protein
MPDNQIGWRLQEDKSVLFDARDGITIRAAWDSPTQIRVEMWRDSDSILIPPDVGNIGSKAFRDRLAKSARERFNPPPSKDEKKSKDTVPHLDEDLGHVATVLGIPEIADMLKEESGPSLVDRLIELVDKAGTLLTTPEGEPHAVLEIDGHTETHEIRGSHFRRWLRGHFYATEKERLEAQAAAVYDRLIDQLGAMAADHQIRVTRPAVIRDQTLADAIAQLESMAFFRKHVEEVHVRAGAAPDGKLYIDLGNDEWDAIEVDAEGWRIVQNPPVRFVRAKGQLALPYPTRDRSVEALREILTLGDDAEDKKAWRLILAWLAQALRPGARHYPILILLGGQGTAKSTTSRMLRNLVDPNTVEDTGEPRSKEELHIDAVCSRVLAYDNLATLKEWLSNALCRIATGSAFTKRTQYTNRDREIFKARQPQILNGISEVATRGDILSRGLLVNLPVITEYREEDEVWSEFYEARPGILGALLDAVSAGLKSIADGEVIADKLPRLADFAKWSIRTEVALGGEPGDFIQAFDYSHDEGTATVLEAEPISYSVYQFARGFSEDAPWEGTSQQLLETLNDREDDDAVKRSAEWPKAPISLSKLLARLAPALVEHGVYWKRATQSNRQGRTYHLYYRKPEGGDASGDGGDASGEGSVPTEDPIDKPDPAYGDAGDAGYATRSDPTDDDEEITL